MNFTRDVYRIKWKRFVLAKKNTKNPSYLKTKGTFSMIKIRALLFINVNNNRSNNQFM